MLCFGLRFFAIRRGWNLPQARLSEMSPEKASSRVEGEQNLTSKEN